MTERVVKAAILINGEPFSVEPPGRHHDVIRTYAEGVDGKRRRFPQSSPQGFMTSAGRFVERAEAARLAFAAGQIKDERQTLYSEDLW